jgi:glycosyltransferase involved in cell wall biosynthesis
MPNLKQKTLVVIASTYPRWPSDTVPNFVENFVNYMRGNVKRIEVVAPHYKGARRKERLAANAGITRFRYVWPYKFENVAYGEFGKTIGYPVKVLLYTIAEFWTALLISLRSRPVILNPRWLIPQGFVGILLGACLRCPVVVSVHGADVFTLNGRVMLGIKRFVLKHADAVVVNSSASLKICMELCPRDDYVICPTGADTGKFKKLKRHRKDSKKFEVLFVGRLIEQKGVMYLCEAMRLLRDTKSNVHLTLVGDGVFKKSVESYIAEHGLQAVITVVGWIQPEDLPAYYAKADVFVGPSIDSGNGWKEGFGTVFAEASAMGLPVIATNTGGIADVVKDGVTGLLVRQKDANALAEAITRLAQNPDLREKLAKQGPEFIEQNFSLNVTTQKYLTIFQRLTL